MYAPLAQLSPEWMLPGISDVETDCATLLATNPAFIEAYMVGLNDGLSRELLWREFPADRTVTFFQNFWGAATPDIDPINTFDPHAQLGGHIGGASSTELVLLIRAALFQRYPNAMVYAAEAKWVNGVRSLSDHVEYPVFRGNFGQDVTFFGFNRLKGIGSRPQWNPGGEPGTKRGGRLQGGKQLRTHRRQGGLSP